MDSMQTGVRLPVSLPIGVRLQVPQPAAPGSLEKRRLVCGLRCHVIFYFTAQKAKNQALSPPAHSLLVEKP
jgi:hypothetical protein